jgi:hypothetical protein
LFEKLNQNFFFEGGPRAKEGKVFITLKDRKKKEINEEE